MTLTIKLLIFFCLSLSSLYVHAQNGNETEDAKPLLLIDAPENFPNSLMKMHQMMQQKLVEFEKNDDGASQKKMMVSYGKKLSSEIKALTKKRKIKEAVAVKSVRDSLLKIYNSKMNKGSKREAASTSKNGQKKVDLIIDGRTQKMLDFNREDCKRSGKYLNLTGSWKKMRMKDTIVGDGDFTVRVVMKVNSISGVGPILAIGDTQFFFDGVDTKLEAKFGALIHSAKLGGKLAGVVSAKENIEWVVKREGEEVFILVNGTEMLREKIHAYELGSVYLWTTTSGFSVSQFSVEGNLVKDIVKTNPIAWSQRPAYFYDTTQWLNYGDESRSYIMTGHRDYKDHSIYIKHSKNREDKEAAATVFEANKGDGRYLMSLSTTANAETGEAHVFYAEGKFNQEVYYKHSKSKGKTWGKPKKITHLLKDTGWNINFEQPGLVKKKGDNEGKVMFTFTAGKEKKDLYLLMSDRNDEWRRVGPILTDCDDSCITEMPDGKLLIVGNLRKKSGLRAKWSSDGGETWGEEIAWKDKIIQHGPQVISFPTKSNPNLLLMSGEIYNNLHANLYYSLDLGVSWKLLARMENSRSWCCQLYRVDESRVLLTTYNNLGGEWNRLESRSHELDINGFGL